MCIITLWFNYSVSDITINVPPPLFLPYLAKFKISLILTSIKKKSTFLRKKHELKNQMSLFFLMSFNFSEEQLIPNVGSVTKRTWIKRKTCNKTRNYIHPNRFFYPPECNNSTTNVASLPTLKKKTFFFQQILQILSFILLQFCFQRMTFPKPSTRW